MYKSCNCIMKKEFLDIAQDAKIILTREDIEAYEDELHYSKNTK